MKSLIYYFSGTGNSLAVARRLAENLGGGVELRPIAGCQNEQSVEVDADLVGLVFPVYFLAVPEIVREFVRKIKFKTDAYIFAVATCNAEPGYSLYSLEKMLGRKGKSLALGFEMVMPGNGIFGKIDKTSPPQVQEERLNNAKAKVLIMGEAIKVRRRGIMEGNNALKKYVASFLMKFYIKHIYRPEKRFRVQNNCTHCRTCQRICPLKNISMDGEGKPVWGKHCAHCLACFHWCPKQAINMDADTIGKRRYHHPAMTVEDMTVS
jgi:Pyruvate/2-oxoacid:ferredoxin oxidoreductase delta subunit/flavodoxin